MTVSFEEFVKYFIKKWKVVALIVFGCVALFVGAAKLMGEEISVPHSEEYLYYEQESAWLESYLEESSLMKMNPTSIPEVTLFLENIGDFEKIKDYILSKQIWEEFTSDRNKDYFYELIKWEESENGNVSVYLRQVTEEETKAAAEYLQQKLQSFDKNMEVTIGTLRNVKDEELQDEQLRWYDRIDYSKSLLLDSQAGFTIKTNTAASAMTGCAAGIVLSVVIVLMMYVLEEKSKKKA